jgi:hypothetical protein
MLLPFSVSEGHEISGLYALVEGIIYLDERFPLPTAIKDQAVAPGYHSDGIVKPEVPEWEITPCAPYLWLKTRRTSRGPWGRG